MSSDKGRWSIDTVPRRWLIYILSGYVLLQFVWWAYMLVDLTGEIHHLRTDLLSVSGMPAPEAQIAQAELTRKLSLRIWMVLGEGAVFIFILLLGIRALQRTISKELQLGAQQRNFLLSVTHELKSPLAAIRLQLQTLAGRELPDAKRQEIYARALADTDRLHDLVENLLLVNRVEAGKFPLHLEVTDLGNMVTELCKTHFQSELSSGMLSVSSESGLMAACDKDAMRSIILNLVENAFKYAVGSPVSVDVLSVDRQVMIAISDLGPGIAEQDRERIFERFYRAGNEDTRSTKGTGIGLYLVRQLVKMHGGTVEAKAGSPTGARFEVRLPTDAQ